MSACFMMLFRIIGCVSEPDSDQDCTAGAERCTCVGGDDGTCQAGLSCLSGLCVRGAADPPSDPVSEDESSTNAPEPDAGRTASSEEADSDAASDPDEKEVMPSVDAGGGDIIDASAGSGGAGSEEEDDGAGEGGSGGTNEVVDDPCAPGAVSLIQGCEDYCRQFLPTCNDFLEPADKYADEGDCSTSCEAFTPPQLSCRIEHLWYGMCSPDYADHCPLGSRNGCEE